MQFLIQAEAIDQEAKERGVGDHRRGGPDPFDDLKEQ